MRALLALVFSLLLPVAAGAAQTPDTARDCFSSTQWRGWSADRETDALYLNVAGRDVYRVQLSPGSRVRRYSGEYLVNVVRGSPWICSALDLDLALQDYQGFSRPLIATELRKLTPEEVEALPEEVRPY